MFAFTLRSGNSWVHSTVVLANLQVRMTHKCEHTLNRQLPSMVYMTMQQFSLLQAWGGDLKKMYGI